MILETKFGLPGFESQKLKAELSNVKLDLTDSKLFRGWMPKFSNKISP
jgi:hypothetical protein